MGFKCNICGKTDGFHGDCVNTAKVSESTETQGCTAMAEDYIYLIDMGDEVVWCDSPAPGRGMDAKDAVKYVRVGFLEKLFKESV